jgi:dihydrofolate synthase/folylpolyglutamate synthase
VAKRQASDAELCASFEAIERARIQQVADIQDDSLILTFPLGGKEHSSPLQAGQGWGEGDDPSEIPLTYFEFGTLAAMQCFIEHKVDVAILEVGLGGRLDAVNIFDADCTVVTSIDIDHSDYLGDTRDQIAYEKAGIFRKDKVAVFGDYDMPETIATEAKRIGAKLWRLGEQFGYKSTQLQWDYFGLQQRHALPLPALRGAYQLNNASSVLAVLDALKHILPVSMEAVRRGLVEVTLSARFQVLPGKPTIILDVAHNPHAARSMARNLAALPPTGHTYAIIAMLKDKDMMGVVAALLPHVDVWLAAGIDAPRGATAVEMEQVLRKAQVKEVIVFTTAREALHHACNRAGENDRILALGSFYTVAEVMRARGLGGV